MVVISLYDSEARLVAIDLGDVAAAADSIPVTANAIVIVDSRGIPVSVELLSADEGVDDQIDAITARNYGSNDDIALEAELLRAAALAALAAPDRSVELTIGPVVASPGGG